jgi:hypothetical protein
MLVILGSEAGEREPVVIEWGDLAEPALDRSDPVLGDGGRPAAADAQAGQLAAAHLDNAAGAGRCRLAGVADPISQRLADRQVDDDLGVVAGIRRH